MTKNGTDKQQYVTVMEEEEGQYKVYPERWWMMGTVILLNLANYAHWIAFPAVAKKAAAYYNVTGEELDMIPTVSYAAGVPTCLVATYIVEQKGLKVGLKIGAYLTGFGGLLCCISTFPGLNTMIPLSTQYWMSLIGQAATGVACPFISCVPTKISQHWFSDSQRTIATTVLGMSYPIGIVLGQGLTPHFIKTPADIPLMNIVFFIPAAFGVLLGIFKVKSSLPPTPPSASAEDDVVATSKMEYFQTVKEIFSNRAYIFMFLFLGGAMAFISCLATKMEQIMCSVGYSDELAGLCCTMVILVGALGTAMFGYLGQKTGKLVEITKLCCLGAIICLLVLAYLLLMPGVPVYIVIASCGVGLFALGVFPMALELTVEATYPADQATVTAFIFLSSSIQGVILMVTENWLGGPLPLDLQKLETCSHIGTEEHGLSSSSISPTTTISTTSSSLTTSDAGSTGHSGVEAKDYTNYLLFVAMYILFLIIIYMFFFKTEFKRTNAGLDRRAARAAPTEKDIESLIPVGLTVVRAKSPRRRLQTC